MVRESPVCVVPSEIQMKELNMVSGIYLKSSIVEKHPNILCWHELVIFIAEWPMKVTLLCQNLHFYLPLEFP